LGAAERAIFGQKNNPPFGGLLSFTL